MDYNIHCQIRKMLILPLKYTAFVIAVNTCLSSGFVITGGSGKSLLLIYANNLFYIILNQ